MVGEGRVRLKKQEKYTLEAEILAEILNYFEWV